MIQECLIGITKLAFDRYEQSLNARNLITALLAPEAKEARAALKAEFAVPIKPGPLLGEPTSEHLQDWEQFWKGEEQREAQVLEADFEKYLKALCEGWFWFESNRRRFTDIRNKQLAHLDTSRVGSDYVLTPVNGPGWKTLKEAIHRLIDLAELLLTVPHRKDESFDQFRQLAREHALNFWRDLLSHQP